MTESNQWFQWADPPSWPKPIQSIQVNLSPEEMELGYRVAVARQTDNIKNNRKAVCSDGSDNRHQQWWDNHILGARGEIAAHKYWMIPYDEARQSRYRWGSKDLPGIEVRSTKGANWWTEKATGTVTGYGLKVYRNNPSNDPYLYCGQLPEPGAFRLGGWAWGWEAKKPENWTQYKRSREGCFHLEQWDLRPLEILRELWDMAQDSGRTLWEQWQRDECKLGRND